jgi:hypothetical protein
MTQLFHLHVKSVNFHKATRVCSFSGHYSNQTDTSTPSGRKRQKKPLNVEVVGEKQATPTRGGGWQETKLKERC